MSKKNLHEPDTLKLVCGQRIKKKCGQSVQRKVPQYDISAEVSPDDAVTSAWASLAGETSERVLECTRREISFDDVSL